VITIEVKSPSELMRHIRAFALNYPSIVARKCDEEFGQIGGEAQEETPVKTGQLRGSLLVEPAQVADGMISITLGFHKNYAIYVHENLEAYHKVGKAKFLEDPLMRHLQTFPKELVDAVEQSLEAG
jgi:hypothetical protein